MPTPVPVHAAEVRRRLSDAVWLVPEADAGSDRPNERFRAAASRFVNGPAHEDRRRVLEQRLAGLDPDGLAATAARLTRELLAGPAAPAPHRTREDVRRQVARTVPVTCLAGHLGFARIEGLADAVAAVAAAYPTGAPSDAADDAVTLMLAAAPGPDAGALAVQLLVQSHLATAALIEGAMRSVDADPARTTHTALSHALRHEPPVPSTRRVGPDGTVAVLPLRDPDPRPAPGFGRSPGDDERATASLAFGAGARACPAPVHALAIAAAVVDGLRRFERGGARDADRDDDARPAPAHRTRGGRPMITAAEFAARHRPGTPLLLPNAWDAASARWLVSRGYDAIGTTSLGIALANGLHDGAGEARDATMRLAEQLTAMRIGVTVDIESGFSDDPDEVATYARRLWELGVLGINIEDSTASGALVDADVAAAKVAAIAAVAPGLFLNARTDAFWVEVGGTTADREADAVARAERYVAVGASGVFVPGTMPVDVIAGIASAVPAPLNVLPQADAGTARLAAAGVARISTGSLLFRAALGAIDEAVANAFGTAPAHRGTPTYAEAVALAGRD